MDLKNFFTFGGVATPGNSAEEIPELFALPLTREFFVDAELRFIYAKILTDVLERTIGIPEKAMNVIADSCLQSDTADGLVTLLSKAIAKMGDLYLVYKPDLGTLREADQNERQLIQDDYKKSGDSKVGVALSFKNFERSKLIEFYSILEFLSVASLYKSANLSKAIQIKVKNLRSSVALGDAEQAVLQAKGIAKALKEGREILADAEDEIVTTTPDVTAVKESLTMLDGKRSFYLGFPISYINGTLNAGLGDTGNADARAVERGLKAYFASIIKPTCEKLFKVKVTFKGEEFGQIDTAMEVLKTFELVGNTYISDENKLLVVNKLLDLKGELPKPIEPTGNANA